MSNAVLEVNNLTKKIKDKTIVHDVSIHIAPGEVVGFVGPNGAGKTTTMRMIVGLVSPTVGRVSINGHHVQEEFSKAMNHVGGVIEGPQLYGYLTGYQNLHHYARMATGVTKERIEEVISLVGLKNRIHEKVKTYSLGMRQRLGLAQAILHSPSLLILDEPTNGLDPTGIREINHYLRKIADEQGVSIFVSSHILPEMEQVCDRILFIQQGKIVDELSINQEDETNRNISVEFIVDESEQAKDYLNKLYPQNRVALSENKLVMDVDHESIAIINKQLVEYGIAVSGIQVKTKRLEERYLEITGGTTEC